MGISSHMTLWKRCGFRLGGSPEVVQLEVF
jgi:hypothetical protein